MEEWMGLGRGLEFAKKSLFCEKLNTNLLAVQSLEYGV
jgi:hypothetical protein